MNILFKKYLSCHWLILHSDAFEVAWSKILSNQASNNICKGLQDIFPGQEYIENHDFNLLYRTVLKLNPLNIDTLLISIPQSLIDERDTKGRIAL